MEILIVVVIAVLLIFGVFGLLAGSIGGLPSAQDNVSWQSTHTKSGNNAKYRESKEGAKPNMNQGMDDKYQEVLSKVRKKLPKVQELEKLYRDLTPDMKERLKGVSGQEFQRLAAQLLAQEGEAVATQRALGLRSTLELEKLDMQIDVISAALETGLRGVVQLQALDRKFASAIDDPQWQTIAKMLLAQHTSHLLRKTQEQAGAVDGAIAQLFLSQPPKGDKADTVNTVEAEWVDEDPTERMKDFGRYNGNGSKPPRG
jgi:hypothetical protein